jgi:hypothetical protein
MSVYDTARTGHEEREMGPCTPRWTGKDRQLSVGGMAFGIRACIGRYWEYDQETSEVLLSSMRHGYYQRCRFEYHEFHKRQV